MNLFSEDSPDFIHMAENKMTANSVTPFKRTLQIDGLFHMKMRQSGLSQSFGNGLKRKLVFLGRTNDGETNTVYGNAFAALEWFSPTFDFERKGGVFSVKLFTNQFSLCLNNSRKHLALNVPFYQKIFTQRN